MKSILYIKASDPLPWNSVDDVRNEKLYAGNSCVPFLNQNIFERTLYIV